MKYFLVETITFNDGKADSVAIYNKNEKKEPYTEKEAIAKAYKELGGWMLQADVQSVNVIVKNERGVISMNVEDTKDAPIAEE